MEKLQADLVRTSEHAIALNEIEVDVCECTNNIQSYLSTGQRLNIDVGKVTVIFPTKSYTLKTENYKEGLVWFSGLVKEGASYVFSPALTVSHINTVAKPLYCWFDGECYYFETNFIKIVN